MLSVMTASAVKRFSSTRSTAVKNVEQQWREHTPLPKTLLHIEHIRELAIQSRACPHAVVELADDGKRSRWNVKASQDSPQESTIDGFIGFGKVDKAHEQRGVLLPRLSLQRCATNIMSTAGRWV